MKRLGTEVEMEIYNLFKEYSKKQQRSLKRQLAWMIEDVLQREGYLLENNRRSIAEKNQAGRLGKAGVQPGSKD